MKKNTPKKFRLPGVANHYTSLPNRSRHKREKLTRIVHKTIPNLYWRRINQQVSCTVIFSSTYAVSDPTSSVYTMSSSMTFFVPRRMAIPSPEIWRRLLRSNTSFKVIINRSTADDRGRPIVTSALKEVLNCKKSLRRILHRAWNGNGWQLEGPYTYSSAVTATLRYVCMLASVQSRLEHTS